MQLSLQLDQLLHEMTRPSTQAPLDKKTLTMGLAPRAPCSRRGAEQEAAYRSLRARRQESINLPDFIQFATVAILGGCFWYQVAAKFTATAVQNTLGELLQPFQHTMVGFSGLFCGSVNQLAYLQGRHGEQITSPCSVQMQKP